MPNDNANSSISDSKGRFVHVPIEVTVSVGKARPSVKELITMVEGSILTLDRKVEDPVELYVGNGLIALGTLEELQDDKHGLLGVRIIEIVDPNQGIE